MNSRDSTRDLYCKRNLVELFKLIVVIMLSKWLSQKKCPSIYIVYYRGIIRKYLYYGAV